MAKVSLPTWREVLPPEVKRAMLDRAGAHVVGIIKRRTAQGVDVTGQPFKPYSERYGALKGKAGRSTTPDLVVSGEMLRSLHTKVTSDTEALVGFDGQAPAVRLTKRARAVKGKTGKRVTHAMRKSAEMIANANKAAWNDKTRHFFDASPKERDEVVREAAKALTLKL